MDKLHYVAKGLLLYETLDADKFIQAFNEELSLDEKAVFAKDEKESKRASHTNENVIKKEKTNTEKSNLDISKVDDFKLPEDEN